MSHGGMSLKLSMRSAPFFGILRLSGKKETPRYWCIPVALTYGVQSWSLTEHHKYTNDRVRNTSLRLPTPSEC